MKFQKLVVKNLMHTLLPSVILGKDIVTWWWTCSLFESPNMALKSSKNVSKSLSKGDWHSNKGVNQARVVPNQSSCQGIQLGLS
jgi:hypothetical protein